MCTFNPNEVLCVAETWQRRTLHIAENPLLKLPRQHIPASHVPQLPYPNHNYLVYIYRDICTYVRVYVDSREGQIVQMSE